MKWWNGTLLGDVELFSGQGVDLLIRVSVRTMIHFAFRPEDIAKCHLSGLL
jgi:hypothetical protein